MVGETHGDFLVLEKTDKRASDKCIIYKCKCIHCGTIDYVASNVLRSIKKHCSNCYIRKTTLIDLKGKTFGFLQVLERDMNFIGHEQDSYWFCKCLKCGSVKSIRGISLRNGNVMSCGCIKSQGEEKIAQLLSENNIKFQREYTFKDLFFKEKKCKLRFDFAIFNQDGSFSHLVEYDGPQHFEEGVRESGWNTLNNYYETIERDKLKNEYCELNNIKLIRIKYNEDFDLNDILGKVEKNDFDK